MPKNSNIAKRDIINNISSQIHISRPESQQFFEKFLSIIKNNLSSKTVKINKFGTFYKTKSKSRIGRNPKTLENYKILSKDKIKLQVSKNIKQKMN